MVDCTRWVGNQLVSCVLHGALEGEGGKGEVSMELTVGSTCCPCTIC
jgi:hypothetical protein